MRGLKEKYEQYHGVRISDAALVTSVELSARYITNRFLPDKVVLIVIASGDLSRSQAIDLMDEACAHTRVQLDSQPEAIDILERQKYTCSHRLRHVSPP